MVAIQNRSIVHRATWDIRTVCVAMPGYRGFADYFLTGTIHDQEILDGIIAEWSAASLGL